MNRERLGTRLLYYDDQAVFTVVVVTSLARASDIPHVLSLQDLEAEESEEVTSESEEEERERVTVGRKRGRGRVEIEYETELEPPAKHKAV